MIRFKAQNNVYTRKGIASARAAERARNMAPCSKTEAIAALANDYDLRGVIFNMAVNAGLIEWDSNAHTWQGVNDAARQSAAEDWRP